MNNRFVTSFNILALQLERRGNKAGFRGPNIRDEFNRIWNLELYQATLDAMFLYLGESQFLYGGIGANLINGRFSSQRNCLKRNDSFNYNYETRNGDESFYILLW